MHEVVQRVLGLRVTLGNRARTLIHKMGVKNASRDILVDPGGAGASSMCWGSTILSICGCSLGGGWWGVISASMQHAQRNAKRASSLFAPAGDRAVERVVVAQKKRRSVVGRPA